MNNVSNNIFPILLADDTTVLIEGNNLDVIITSLNSELDSGDMEVFIDHPNI